MKAIILILSLTFFSNAFANIVKLNSKEVHLGSLVQPYATPLNYTFEAERTKKTPEKVKLAFFLHMMKNVCTIWDERRIWIPGHYDIFGNWIPGHWRFERYCARYEDQFLPEKKTVYLDFKKAQKLKDGETELFKLNILQESIHGQSVDMIGEFLDANRTGYDYIIDNRAGRGGLVFTLD